MATLRSSSRGVSGSARRVVLGVGVAGAIVVVLVRELGGMMAQRFANGATAN
jgi:hypothetical protein